MGTHNLTYTQGLCDPNPTYTHASENHNPTYTHRWVPLTHLPAYSNLNLDKLATYASTKHLLGVSNIEI
jgi:hypothetical protein